ncbi:hypothetical protein CDD83_419 [Cordyceps sp. RAO-2017]|nr:hypothetical protein CDD83_419 [Cordyceps sp. RAO-2017]
MPHKAAPVSQAFPSTPAFSPISLESTATNVLLDLLRNKPRPPSPTSSLAGSAKERNPPPPFWSQVSQCESGKGNLPAIIRIAPLGAMRAMRPSPLLSTRFARSVPHKGEHSLISPHSPRAGEGGKKVDSRPCDVACPAGRFPGRQLAGREDPIGSRTEASRRLQRTAHAPRARGVRSEPRPVLPSRPKIPHGHPAVVLARQDAPPILGSRLACTPPPQGTPGCGCAGLTRAAETSGRLSSSGRDALAPPRLDVWLLRKNEAGWMPACLPACLPTANAIIVGLSRTLAPPPSVDDKAARPRIFGAADLAGELS